MARSSNAPNIKSNRLTLTTLAMLSCFILALGIVGLFLNTVPIAEAQSDENKETVSVKYGDTTFDIATTYSNGKVVNATLIFEDNQLLLDLDPSQTEDGQLNVTLPRALIDSKLEDLSADEQFTIVLSDSEATFVETASTDTARTLSIDIPVGTEFLTIVGTQVVPEFPIGITLVMSAILGGAVLSTRVLRMTHRS